MAIPSQQIGWGTEEKLLWQISKQLQQLIGVASKVGQPAVIPIYAYSQQLNFPIYWPYVQLQCDGSGGQNFFSDTSGPANNMAELANIFNSTNPSQLGVYSDNGDGRLKLTVTQAIKTQYCPTGTLSFNVYSD